MPVKFLVVICVVIRIYGGEGASVGRNGGAEDAKSAERRRNDEQTSPKTKGRVGGMGGIVGGTNAVRGDHPWQALITGPIGICGATIIDDHHIMTAAHCLEHAIEPMIDYPELYEVIVGNYRLHGFDNTEQRLEVASSVMHEDYKGASTNFDNDVAIITTRQKIRFSKFVQPAILPWDTNSSTLYKPGTKALISGWGYTAQRHPKRRPNRKIDKVSDILQAAEVIVRDTNVCEKAMIKHNWCGDKDTCPYSLIIQLFGHKLSENMFCAGYFEGKIDTCQGDSGGPLVVKDDKGRPILTGVASWGEGCAWPGLPGIYAKVSNYQRWVENHLNSS